MAARARKSWTDAKIRAEKPGPQRREISVEDGGLYIVVPPSGSKWWWYRYKVNGKTERLKLGDYPTMGLAEAREKFRVLRGVASSARVGESATPKQRVSEAVAEQLAKPTLAELADRWLDLQATGKKTKHERRRTLDTDVLPKLGKSRVHDIRRTHCSAVIDAKLGQGKPGQAREIYKTLRTLLSYAVEKGVIDVSPMQGMKPPSRYVPKDRHLSDVEVTAFFSALAASEASDMVKACLEWQFLTASRPSESRDARWNEIDEAAKPGPTWTIPASRSKNGKALVVHLSPAAMAVLDRVRDLKPEDVQDAPVFPGRIKGAPLSELAVTRAVSRLQSACETHLREKSGNGAATFAPFTPHDLRRTAASIVTSLGFNRFTAGLLLNHTDSSVTSIYDRHDYEGDKRAAWLALGVHVAALKVASASDATTSLEAGCVNEVDDDVLSPAWPAQLTGVADEVVGVARGEPIK